MRNTNSNRADDRRSQSRWRTTIVVTAMLAGGSVLPGCGERCQNADPLQLAAFEAAWRGDTDRMRGLIAQNSALANARECEPPHNLASWIIARQMGAGTTSVLHVAARQGHSEFVTLLLANGAEVDARDGLAASPLHLAAQYGHDESVALLLAAKAPVDSRKNGGLTPLHVAAGHGRFPVVKRLLAAGADVNAREGGGWTPLHRAASEGRENIIRVLLEHGADPLARDEQGSSPLEYAVLNGNLGAIELLTPLGVGVCGQGDGMSALALAAQDGDAEIVRLLLSKGASVNERHKNGQTPLQFAINQYPEAGGDDWAKTRNTNRRRVVETLLSSGADIEVRGKDGNRPLHTVALFGHADLTALLVTRGADINARNDWGWTPLHFAASQDQADIVDVLLKYGADVQARNKSGRTPLGEVSRNTRIESALKKRGAQR